MTEGGKDKAATPLRDGLSESDAARDEATRRHHRLAGRWILGLLVMCCTVTFGVAFFARALAFEVFDWPFSFWVAAQGAPLVYLAIVIVYARVMDRLESQVSTPSDR